MLRIIKVHMLIILVDHSPVWDGDTLTFLFSSTEDKTSFRETALTRRLVAASAAYISVLMRGRVNVQLKDGVVVVKAPGRSTCFAQLLV